MSTGEPPEPLNGFHIEHGEERYERGPASVKSEWWELYENGGRYLCTFRDPDDAERVMKLLARTPASTGEREELVAIFAKAIYDAMVHAAREFKGEPQPWQNGNSTAESYARREARDILAALQSRVSPQEGLREALEKCRAKFAEYVGLHMAKLTDDAVLGVREAIWRKVESNQEMVDLCDAALSASRMSEDAKP